MPIDFPSSPSNDQSYTYNNFVWVYNSLLSLLSLYCDSSLSNVSIAITIQYTKLIRFFYMIIQKL